MGYFVDDKAGQNVRLSMVRGAYIASARNTFEASSSSERPIVGNYCNGANETRTE